MKHYISITCLLLSIRLSAQNTPIFDSVKLERGTKLIGRYPQYDKNKTYISWNFCIDDSAEIRTSLDLLTVGEEVPNAIQNPSFSIALVQGYKETRYWRINLSAWKQQSNF
jgi:hypothetical protein